MILLCEPQCEYKLRPGLVRHGRSVDAHGQIDESVDFETAIHLMDQAGIRRVILTPVGRCTPHKIVKFSRQYPDRVLPSVRTKTPAYLYNNGNLDQALRKHVDTGNFGAIAELLMYHAEKRRGAAENRALETIIYPSDRACKPRCDSCSLVCEGAIKDRQG